MKASGLTEGDRFVWRRSGTYPYESPMSTVLADPRQNRRGEVTFPVLYDEPTGREGNVYDVFFLDPDEDVEMEDER